MEDNVVDHDKVNQKKQVRVPDEVLEGLGAETGDIIVFIEKQGRYEIDTGEVKI